jgi:hypothetical protein
MRLVPLERIYLPLSCAYAERTKRRSDTIWALILRHSGPGLQIVIEVKFGNCGPTLPKLVCPNLNPKACYPFFPWYKMGAPLPCPSLFPRKTQQPAPHVVPFLLTSKISNCRPWKHHRSARIFPILVAAQIFSSCPNLSLMNLGVLLISGTPSSRCWELCRVITKITIAVLSFTAADHPQPPLIMW